MSNLLAFVLELPANVLLVIPLDNICKIWVKRKEKQTFKSNLREF